VVDGAIVGADEEQTVEVLHGISFSRERSSIDLPEECLPIASPYLVTGKFGRLEASLMKEARYRLA
jgi:hypothetical protein